MRTVLFLFLGLVSVISWDLAHGMAETDFVTITLPEKVIRQSIESTLPLQLNQDRGHLEGSLVLEKVDLFELGNNLAVVHGLILGRDLVLTTRIGNQDVKLQLGGMRLPISCNFTFRFDPLDKNLYITPHLADSLSNAPPDQASKMLPFLAMLDNREYPVSFESLTGFRTRIGESHLAVVMEPVDIQVSERELVLKMVPRVNKTN